MDTESAAPVITAHVSYNWHVHGFGKPVGVEFFSDGRSLGTVWCKSVTSAKRQITMRKATVTKGARHLK